MSLWSPGPSVLMYHSISDRSKEPYSVSIAAFSRQISWLIENGFEIIPLSSLCRSINTNQCQRFKKKVVITFDDGYKNFLTNALPILQMFNAHATVFVVTDMLGGKSVWNKIAPDEKLMSEDEVRYIKSKGISIGSHTATHINLGKTDPKDIELQLQRSLDKIIEIGESFYSLSYPFGQWTRRVLPAVKACGYKCAMAVGEYTSMSSDNLFMLPRITMMNNIESGQFARIMKTSDLKKELRRSYRKLRKAMMLFSK
jgi:peptidoglycan/xylan/chitin deacetylase (PgdA/CDA1 family)